ncbi:hypothetical protein GCM10010401_01410 [Rarobacter faecitabidus]|uniref:Uncharacterized protein n=1 Tax=Rarobacter faecitabidus TaxID=13243 RepID=A0A542ZWH6_RARFA|nr:hypothetical protein [Rarobacter faecitabidus]TQL64724.1 hypothetical protein FB461_1233 [Rarobacter faecitabidus]
MTTSAHLERYLATFVKSARAGRLSQDEASVAAADVIISIEHLVARDIDAYSKRARLATA